MGREELETILTNLPELKAGIDFWQNRFHEFDVYTHTLEYVRHLKTMTDDLELIVAGYLHDIAKPIVARPKIKDGKPVEKAPGIPYHEFDDHEIAGEAFVRSMNPAFFHEHGINQDRIARLVGAHYLPLNGIKLMRKAKTYAEFSTAYKTLEQSLDATGLARADVLTMFLADSLAKGTGCTDIEELLLIRKTVLTEGSSLHDVYELQKRLYKNKE